MSLSDLLTAVSTQVFAAVDRNSALEAAAALLACDPVEPAQVLSHLIEREALASTAIGHGIAIPHARIAGLPGPRGALLRLTTAVAFGDGEPVDLVFALAVPEHYPHQHLLLLSELAQLFSDADVREALRAAPDSSSLKHLIDSPPRIGSA